jgi:hypothetical protein
MSVYLWSLLVLVFLAGFAIGLLIAYFHRP